MSAFDFTHHPEKCPPPIVRAFCPHVSDGDSFRLIVDNFFDTTRKIRVRLLGIDCWERKRPTLAEGNAARDRTKSLILLKPVMAQTFYDALEFDRYGRYRTIVWHYDEWGQRVLLADTLRAEGHEKIL